MTAENARLRLELEATLTRFEREMKRAVKSGTVTATTLENRFNAMSSSMARSSTRAAAGLSNVVSISRGGRFVLQNTANQIGDIAVQLENNTSAMRVLGQQLPQILGGFGALGGVLGILGPLLGTVAAVGFPLAAMFLMTGKDADDAGEKVKTFADKLNDAEGAIKRASSALEMAGIQGLDKLGERYGEVTEKVRELSMALLDIEMRAAQGALGVVLNEAFGEGFQRQLDSVFGGVGQVLASAGTEAAKEQAEALRQEIADITAQIQVFQATQQAIPAGLTAQLSALNEELAAVEGRVAEIGTLADGLIVSPEEVATIAALRDRLAEAQAAGDFAGVADAVNEIRAALEATGTELDQVVIDALVRAEDQARFMAEQIREAESAADGTADAASGIAGAISPAVSEAARLAQQLGIAFDLAQRIAGFGPQGLPSGEKGRGGAVDPRTVGGSFLDRQTAEATEFLRNYKPPKTRSRGGGRGRSKKSPQQEFEEAFLATSEREITALQRQIEMLGKSKAEVAELQTKWRLLDAAKKAGIPVTEELTKRIDAEAAEVRDLAAQYELAQQGLSDMETLNNTFKDSIIDAADGGADAFDRLKGAIKRAALQYALFGEGPLSGIFGGGFGGLLGGLFGGKRAAGGPVDAGKTYMVGERGPEMFVPRVSGMIVPNHKMGGGAVDVRVGVDRSGNLMPVIERVSGQVSARTTAIGLQAQDRAVPQRLSAFEARGT